MSRYFRTAIGWLGASVITLGCSCVVPTSPDAGSDGGGADAGEYPADASVWIAHDGERVLIARISTDSSATVQTIIEPSRITVAIGRLPRELLLRSVEWNGHVLTEEDAQPADIVVTDLFSASYQLIRASPPAWFVVTTVPDRTRRELKLMTSMESHLLDTCTNFAGIETPVTDESAWVFGYRGQCGSDSAVGVYVALVNATTLQIERRMFTASGIGFSLAPIDAKQASISTTVTVQRDGGNELSVGVILLNLADGGRTEAMPIEYPLAGLLDKDTFMTTTSASPQPPLMNTTSHYGYFRDGGIVWELAEDLNNAVPVVQRAKRASGMTVVEGVDLDGHRRRALLNRGVLTRTFVGPEWLTGARDIAIFDELICGTVQSAEVTDAGGFNVYSVRCAAMH